jgi:WD40 repeat protein
VWDLDNGRALRTLEGHASHVSGVALTLDGRRVISASWDKTLKVWDLDNGLLLATFHCDAPARCCACADERRIVGGDDGGRVYILRLEE